MGASRHRGNGVHGIGSRHGAARSDRSSRGNVRRIRARARALTPLAAARVLRAGRSASACCWPGPFCTRRPARRCATRFPSATRSRRAHDSTNAACPTRADSLLRDSLAKRDSIRRARISADTIKAPHRARRGRRSCRDRSRDAALDARLAVRHRRDHGRRSARTRSGRVDLPRPAGSPRRRSARTSATCGACACSTTGSRCSRSIRAAGGVLDLTQINLWSAEEAAIEQAPEEVRVYLRSWRVRNTHADTRTDISTGDQQTNLYRGFFGRRFDNGGAFQFGAQQYGTTPPIVFGTSSDRLGLIGARGLGEATSGASTRSPRASGDTAAASSARRVQRDGDSIPDTRVDAQRRVLPRRRTRDPDTIASWAQVMAVGSKYGYTGIRTPPSIIPKTPAESALAIASLDTGVFRSQYIATAGLGARPAPTQRRGASLHRGTSDSLVARCARASRPRALIISAYAEARASIPSPVSDVTAQLTPFSFVSASRRRRPTRPVTRVRTARSIQRRTTCGARPGFACTISGFSAACCGATARFSRGPASFDTLFAPARVTGRRPESTAAIRGQLWRLIDADICGDSVERFDGLLSAAVSNAQRAVRARRTCSTGSRRGLRAAWRRSFTSTGRRAFPVTGVSASAGGHIGYRTISTLLEIRVLSATVSWQFRNILGERYSQVPVFIMPRQTNYYGVRWDFVN